MAGAICPACFDGAHSECIEQGCYCACQLPDDEVYTERECVHGLVHSMCEICEQEEQ